MSNDYAVMARKQDGEYFKIVKYDGKRAFSEDEALKIKELLGQRDYETVVVEHRSPFDITNLDDLLMGEFITKKMESSKK